MLIQSSLNIHQYSPSSNPSFTAMPRNSSRFVRDWSKKAQNEKPLFEKPLKFLRLLKKFGTKIKEKFSYFKEACSEKFGLNKTEKSITKTYMATRGGVRCLKKDLKKYLDALKPGENVNPAKLEELLIKSGAVDVTEAEGIRFIPTADYPLGKKKKFILDGKAYILETHNGSGSMNTVSRLYLDGPKAQREYLTSRGIFESNSYNSPTSHLFSGLQGLEWIRG